MVDSEITGIDSFCNGKIFNSRFIISFFILFVTGAEEQSNFLIELLLRFFASSDAFNIKL